MATVSRVPLAGAPPTRPQRPGAAYACRRRTGNACDCGNRRIWRAPPQLSLVLSVVVFGAGIEACAITYGMRRQRALRLLQLGLDRYGDFV